MKLDCNIADDTSAIKLTLWDKNIPLVQEGEVFEIVNARVRSYQGEKYLSSNFETIITTVKSDARNMRVVSQLMENEESISKNTTCIVVNQIGGVQEIQRYAVCNSCRRKLGNLQSDLSICDSCGLSQIKTAADQTHFSVGVFIGGEHNVLLKGSSRSGGIFYKGPVYMEKSCPGQEGHPPSRVNFTARLYEKKC